MKFLFLPVDRIGAHLIISAHAIDILSDCPLKCGIYGRCSIYTNVDEYFCRCDSGWTGIDCTIKMIGCDCSSDSICLCPVTKIGPRCILCSACRENPCQNDGQCVPDDYQISTNAFKFICKGILSGKLCEVQDVPFQYCSSTKQLFDKEILTWYLLRRVK